MVNHFVSYLSIVHYIPHCSRTSQQTEEKAEARS